MLNKMRYKCSNVQVPALMHCRRAVRQTKLTCTKIIFLFFFFFSFLFLLVVLFFFWKKMLKFACVEGGGYTTFSTAFYKNMHKGNVMFTILYNTYIITKARKKKTSSQFIVKDSLCLSFIKPLSHSLVWHK